MFDELTREWILANERRVFCVGESWILSFYCGGGELTKNIPEDNFRKEFIFQIVIL